MNHRVHGGDLQQVQKHYPDAPQPWIDLSTGINPHSWPWREKISSAELEQAVRRLPGQADMVFCRDACADYLGVGAEKIILTPGSQAAIELLPRCFETNRKVIVPGPTYSEHLRSWSAAGFQVETKPYDWDGLTGLPGGSILVLTHPNNPDGQTFDTEKLYQLSMRHIERGGMVIVDEAFADIDPALSLLTFPLSDGLVVLRSAGKFSGLAGLRLGTVVTSGTVSQRLNNLCQLWEISTLTLRVFGHFYRDLSWISAMREQLAGEMRRLQELLEKYGYSITGSTSLYCLTEAEDAAGKAGKLAQAGIYVRTFPDHPSWLRFGVPGSEEAWNRLAQQLRG
ncbi:threonine-phosphate decarboxylase [Emcibacter nanhaiensis]|uniref:Aminotransferase n=1 Tax=Emcibacter nanhaiensis TaxID=1505037 RepID=A0A501PKQ2_9PROT|nr:threonine-phosphate decarboxylase [Emcibacter nanhaiensis]TPD60637.1 pyridoxal phosphate-dependent class II aminotransferase [Emcibacter nanhaiensis]